MYDTQVYNLCACIFLYYILFFIYYICFKHHFIFYFMTYMSTFIKINLYHHQHTTQYSVKTIRWVTITKSLPIHFQQTKTFTNPKINDHKNLHDSQSYHSQQFQTSKTDRSHNSIFTSKSNISESIKRERVSRRRLLVSRLLLLYIL